MINRKVINPHLSIPAAAQNGLEPFKSRIMLRLCLAFRRAVALFQGVLFLRPSETGR
jgi:hypothetical protein